MLIEFSVSNFRSFREKQTLSMVATPRLSKKKNVFKAVVDGEKLPDLLKVAAIYGPNASGKSSLIHALEVVREIINTPISAEGLLPVKPFRFDPALKDEPSRFEFHFVHGGLRYQFLLALTESRIIEETMFSYPKGKEALLYKRVFVESGEKYVFGEELEGGKEVHSVWRKLTSPKALFISQAVLNSSEELNQLRQPWEWFKKYLLVIEQDAMQGWSHASKRFLEKVPDATESLELFLQEVDVPVSRIKLEVEESNTYPDAFGSRKKTSDDKIGVEYKTTLTHKSLLGEADFDFSEESGGTRNLIGFWLPWMMVNYTATEGSGVLVVDELDSSVHPEIVADLIRTHLDRKIDSQLIFTTHDTHLMNAKILRRDQIWITERDVNGATNLFSVHDFEGREGEDVEKRYFEGRYRGLPMVRRK